MVARWHLARTTCSICGNFWSLVVTLKALANEDTLLPTHCCRHKCFPVCPRAQHLLRTQILCPGPKKCFWFCSETFCVRNKCFPVCAAQETSWATMCLRLPGPLVTHGQSCSLGLTRAYSWPLVATPGHSWVLLARSRITRPVQASVWLIIRHNNTTEIFWGYLTRGYLWSLVATRDYF